MDTQLRLLIIDPILAIAQNGVGVLDPRLIVIDGLDECKDKATQSEIINCFASTVMHRQLQVRVLILSRPEQPLRGAFSYWGQRGEYVSVVLDDDETAYGDVERYLRQGFEEIRKTHPLKQYIPREWPSHGDIGALVTKSSSRIYSYN